MRRYIQTLAVIFSRVELGAIIAIAIAFLFNGLSFASILKLLGVAVLVVFTFQTIGYVLTLWSESIPANITISTSDYMDTERSAEPSTEEPIFIESYYAFLRVVNNEQSQITDCYALLKSAENIKLPSNSVRFIFGPGSKRLRWKNNRNNRNCEISIGETEEEILYAYQISMRRTSNDLTFGISDFAYCNEEKRIRLDEEASYKTEIEFRGKLATGQEIKKSFPYLLKVQTVQKGRNDLTFDAVITAPYPQPNR